ncbi:hypothetical protein [Salinigranum sp.]|uniref:hypothetical protein n=1 Tax=Salinigranum sp. TaxID=1966351 RepID=UPI00356377AB
MPTTATTILIAGGLAAVHLFAGKLRFLAVVPRSQYLSMAGGVSVAYVFVHLLPEISERQSELAVDAGAPAATELPLFLVALFGFTVFYGLEQFVVQSRRTAEGRQVVSAFETNASALAFWLHVSSFALYNALVGYLSLHREESGLAAAALYFVAMALHFVVNDHGLREHHREAYVHLGRWILALAVVGGVLAGVLVDVPELALGYLLAFLGGSVVLNAIKEELPEERRSSFGAFGAGVVAYTLVLLSV